MPLLSGYFGFKAARESAKRILVVTDPGRDPDDEVLFAQLSGLSRLGYAKVVGVVVNQTPSEERARLAKATFNVFSKGIPSGAFDVKAFMVKAHLKAVGLHHVPVAIGTEGDVSHKLRPYEFNVPYLHLAQGEKIEADGQAFMKAQLEQAQAKGEKVTLLLVSGMKDADLFIKANPELAKAALESVQIMGGIEVDKDQKPLLDKDGLLQPDNAANNKFGSHENDDPSDPISKYARSLYASLQKLDIPADVITRHAAYKAQIPGSYYTKLADTKHPVGIRLCDMQKAAIVGLFEDVCQEGGHPNKRLTPQWFANTFLLEPEKDLAVLLKSTDDIMDRIKGFNPYDPLTALNVFFPKLFNPYKHENSSMRIVGISADEHGVNDVAGVHKLLELLPRIGFGLEPAQSWKIALATLGMLLPRLPENLKKFEA